jgi:hypothetical protein
MVLLLGALWWHHRKAAVSLQRVSLVSIKFGLWKLVVRRVGLLLPRWFPPFSEGVTSLALTPTPSCPLTPPQAATTTTTGLLIQTK